MEKPRKILFLDRMRHGWSAQLMLELNVEWTEVFLFKQNYFGEQDWLKTAIPIFILTAL